jgi:hypothetical protein
LILIKNNFIKIIFIKEMSKCSEVENMKISISYYNFIKEVFEDYINSVSYYKDITIEYIKKLKKFQDKFGENLIE